MRREISTELKELRLHGMAQAWDELTTHEGKPTDVGIQTSRWLIEHLLQAEHTQRKRSSNPNTSRNCSGRQICYTHIPRQQRLHCVNRTGCWQVAQYMTQPGIGLQPIGFGRLHQ